MNTRIGNINYLMVPNVLTDPPQYSARVVHNTKVIGNSELVYYINQETRLSSATIESVLTAIKTVVPTLLALGNVINLEGLVSLRAGLTMPPNQTDPNYMVTVDNAQLNIDARTNLGLRDSVRALVNYTKVAYTEKVPVIEDMFNMHLDLHNVLDGGSTSDVNVVRLTGDNLDFDPSDATQGVFLIDKDGVARKVGQPGPYTPYKITNRYIEFQTSATDVVTESAPYTIEVRAKYTPTGTLRTGTYNTPLTTNTG